MTALAVARSRAQRSKSRPVWRVESDLDGFPAPGGGGLLDTSARVVWAASHHASMSLGIRYQTGEATQDTFFNCVHQRTALAGLRFDF